MSTQTETGIDTRLLIRRGEFVEAEGGATFGFTETRLITVQRGPHPFPF